MAPQPEHRSPDPAAILVVDDNASNLLAIEAAFAGMAHELVKARSGREALRHLLERDFALILLDVKMPDMDGFETARLIRERARSRHVPIIFVTAYRREDDEILEGYSLGAVDFLFKPIVPQVLRAKASVFVELRRQAERLREMERQAQARRLEEERQRWEAEALRQENDRKDEFIAMLAHELRNPMATISVSLDLLGRRLLSPEKEAEVREAMVRQVRHLKRLVDDLLDVSRISSGKITLRFSIVDLGDVVRQAVEATRQSVDERRHQLDIRLPEAPLQTWADADRLTQVFCNLLNNAARYTEPGGSINLSCDLDGEDIRIEVKDTGKGISAEMLPRIFDLFVQGHGSGAGLGVGLALVQRLVQMHGGSVVARSEGEGRGASFEVRIPRRQPPEEATSGPILPAPGASSSLPLRIVLIEDEDDIRQTTAALLGSWGHTVHTAASGEDGIAEVTSWHPDVVLVDIGMPGMDGFAVAEQLRARLGPDTPRLVALTGYGTARDRERGRKAGFDAHLLKPVEADELQAAIAIPVPSTSPPETGQALKKSFEGASPTET